MLTRRTAITGLGAAWAISACRAPGSNAAQAPKDFILSGVKNVTRVTQLTGPEAINDTMQVHLAGCDLGSMFEDDNRVWLLFGDNFGERDRDAYGGTGQFWKSNCLAWTTDRQPKNSLHFDGWILDEWHQVKEILPGAHQGDGAGEVTKIPTQGFAIDGTLYCAFMSVRHWGEAGVWTTTGGTALIYEGLSPWGPWSQPRTILTQDQLPGLYSPYLCPRYTDGAHIYFTLSVWGPYQVFWYSLDLVREGGIRS